MKQSINDLGFRGDLYFLHNEEGSGAKFYKRSCYYPDSVISPRTNSGITIDPGLDLGNANKDLCAQVLNLYASEKLITTMQLSLLFEAVGLKKHRAIAWLKANKGMFKNRFLVPDRVAVNVLRDITAVPYWRIVIGALPVLRTLDDLMARGIHTSLLSLAYNASPARAITLSDRYLREGNYTLLANKIEFMPSPTGSLKQRRYREAELIRRVIMLKNKAIKQQEPVFNFEELNPMPLSVIPFSLQEAVKEDIKRELYRYQEEGICCL